MNFLRNFKIGARLGLAFGSTLLLMCLIGLLGAWQITKVNDGAAEIATNWLPSIKAIADVESSLNSARRAALRHVLETEPSAKQTQRTVHDEIIKNKLPEQLAVYEKLISSPAEKSLYDTFRAGLSVAIGHEHRLIELSDGGEAGLAAARQFANVESAKSFANAMTAISALVRLNAEGSAKEASTAAGTYREALIASAALVAVGLLVGSVFAWQISTSITTPMRQAVKIAETVAKGDLTSKVEVHGRDEAADLLRALGGMNAQLVKIVGEVRQSSDSIATGSSQIASGNADLSQRTETQASNLQQTAASMEELTSTVKNNADSAQQANQLAGAASAAAAQGGQVVSQVITTMQDITTSSKKISDIIGVIDGIAFQTNILALNAAVEAARAGEQGRGFAVVASEVRSLAQRSANAAKEIKALIGDSVEKVETGSRLVNDAGQSMDDIVRQVQRVSDLIGEISSATIEQTSGIGQVGNAVTELDRSTQQNAALVEESAAAAESLKHQASRLAEVVGVFKLSKDEASAALAKAKKEPPRLAAPKPASAPAKPAPTRAVAAPAARAPASTPAARPAARAPALRPAPSASAKPAAAPVKVASAKSGDDGDWESF
jgi:methyl-accepting chemotaxis protein